MSDLLNFGFDPTGTALGGEGSPSMPGDPLTGLEHPVDANMAAFDDFVVQTQRRYGEVSDPGGTIYDPRGERAFSAKPSDYKDTDLMRPDEIPLRLSGSDDQLFGGDPVLARYNPDTSGFAQALYDQDIGLSQQGAATLADSLAAYDPKILEGIKLPRTVEPRVTNELGLTGQHGGLPAAFFDPGTGVVKQGVPEAVDRVIAQGGQYQHVDRNGVVNKYTPGTGPYDAIREGRMAYTRMGQPGTPNANGGGMTAARMQQSGGSALSAAQSAGTDRYQWKAVSSGQFAGVEGSADNWTALSQWPGGLPATPKPTEFYAKGGKTSFFYAIGENYAYRLMRWTGSKWIPVKVPGGAQQPSLSQGGQTLAPAGSGSGGGDIADSGLPSDDSGEGAGSYSADGGYALDEGGAAIEEEIGEEKPCSKWWWLLLLIPVAGGGIYYATRKKKRGRK